MAATLIPALDATETPSTEGGVLPLINPITVSMALAVVFLIGVLLAVSVRPAGAGDTRGADEQVPRVVAEASADG